MMPPGPGGCPHRITGGSNALMPWRSRGARLQSAEAFNCRSWRLPLAGRTACAAGSVSGRTAAGDSTALAANRTMAVVLGELDPLDECQQLRNAEREQRGMAFASCRS